MSDKAKLLLAYFLTCQFSNGIGCYRLPLAYICDDLRWDMETVTQTLSETVSIGLISYDENHKFLFIKTFLEHNKIDNPNVGKSLTKFIDMVPKDCSFYSALICQLERQEEKFPEGYINGLANRSPNPIEEGLGNREQKQQPYSLKDKPLKQHSITSPRDSPDALLKDFLPGKDLNEFFNACEAVRCLLGKVLKREDQELIAIWLEHHDMRTEILPLMVSNLIKFQAREGKNPNSLAYFKPIIEGLGKKRVAKGKG